MQIEAEDETHPTCSGLDMTGECRDATVEEALHLVTGPFINYGIRSGYLFGQQNANFC